MAHPTELGPVSLLCFFFCILFSFSDWSSVFSFFSRIEMAHPTELGPVIHLCRRKSHITDIPSQVISSYNFVQILDFSNNNLTSLPVGIAEIQKLDKLILCKKPPLFFLFLSFFFFCVSSDQLTTWKS